MTTNQTAFTDIDQLSYNQAIAELEDILRNMQSDNCDIDKLTLYTRRASQLLNECKRRLTVTDRELRDILADMEK
ncbi:MAG: exodeoxyribonuclease VII small subunit [Muribaculaceae bacterium]|nr:exodeoxyribonuclease VII small subunit [Muribaculaceae bacterium]